MRVVFNVGWSNTAERITHALGRFAGVPPLPIYWHHPTGPHFGNELGLLVFDGRSARIVLEKSVRAGKPARGEAGDGPQPGLAIVADLPLTDDQPI